MTVESTLCLFHYYKFLSLCLPPVNVCHDLTLLVSVFIGLSNPLNPPKKICITAYVNQVPIPSSREVKGKYRMQVKVVTTTMNNRRGR